MNRRNYMQQDSPDSVNCATCGRMHTAIIDHDKDKGNQCQCMY
ncbi:hypothetical protein BH18THE2_BH18THE2_18060 [soil metagenome]